MRNLLEQIKSSKIILKNINDLMPYARNSRKHDEWQIAQIAASIKEFGFTNPVLTDKDGTIIAGHARVMAAMKLNLEEIPCIELVHLTETQKKAYIIADNQLALNSGWDYDFLRLEIEELKLETFDVNLLGFDDKSLNDILNLQPPKTENISAELNAGDFENFAHECPKCGFQFNDK